MLTTLFTSPAIYFAGPGLLGMIFVVLRLLLVFMGIGDHDAHGVDSPVGGGDHHGGGDGLNLLSVQSLMTFLMGFGWAGLLSLLVLDWPMGGCVGFGVGVGAALTVAQAFLWKSMFRLQGSGNIQINSTMGIEGVVYVAIPPAGKGLGQVRLVIDGRQRMYNALTRGTSEIVSQTRVRVVGVNDDNTVSVEAI